MKAILNLLILCLVLTKTMVAQEITETPMDTLTRSVSNLLDENTKSKRLKITGYVQPQFQYIDSSGAPSVAGGDFNTNGSPYYSRFMMRRGRFKFTYNLGNVEYMCNIDATEKGLNMRETYAKITDKWKEMFSLTVGLLQVQYGFELTQSSGVRETPERARYNQILFPVERDLGAFGSMVVPKSSKLYGLKIDLAVMNGAAGVAPEFDSNKDFTGRIQYSKTSKNEKTTFAVASSGYYGGYRIGAAKDFTFATLSNGEKGFVATTDSANKKINRIAKRIYYGFDAQFSIDWSPGITTLRAEYIQGINPGTATSNRSPGAPPATNVPLYSRNFNGGYFYFIQNIGTSRFQVVFKYDWFDPNTKLGGTRIGKTGTYTGLGDIRFDTFGFGGTYRINSAAKLVVYYDIVKNERTRTKLYTGDIRDNVFTVRYQIRF